MGYKFKKNVLKTGILEALDCIVSIPYRKLRSSYHRNTLFASTTVHPITLFQIHIVLLSNKKDLKSTRFAKVRNQLTLIESTKCWLLAGFVGCLFKRKLQAFPRRPSGLFAPTPVTSS